MINLQYQGVLELNLESELQGAVQYLIIVRIEKPRPGDHRISRVR
jgi:hypothetical protein